MLSLKKPTVHLQQLKILKWVKRIMLSTEYINDQELFDKRGWEYKYRYWTISQMMKTASQSLQILKRNSHTGLIIMCKQLS
jgi:hypothetical protein